MKKKVILVDGEEVRNAGSSDRGFQSNSSFSMMGAFFSIYDDVNIILPNIWFKEYPESIFEKYYSEHCNQDEIILLSQKVHDINGKTLFLGC